MKLFSLKIASAAPTHTFFFLPAAAGPCPVTELTFLERNFYRMWNSFSSSNHSHSPRVYSLSLPPSFCLYLSKKLFWNRSYSNPTRKLSFHSLSRSKSFWLSFLPRSLSVSHSLSRSAERNDQSMILFEYQVSNLFMIFDKNSNHDKCDDGVCSFKINVSVNAFKNVRSKWSPPFIFQHFELY